jgi:hypothetical protein
VLRPRISWTRTALAIPEDVREEVERTLRALLRYYPEVKGDIRIGRTRSLDGAVFQSEDGRIKLMLDVRRRRKGGWRLPTRWTLAHELMHLAQFNGRGIPAGERACDVYALARVPPRFMDDSPSYLVVPPSRRRRWTARDARLAHDVARRAIRKRGAGLRRYAAWWEAEFERLSRG